MTPTSHCYFDYRQSMQCGPHAPGPGLGLGQPAAAPGARGRKCVLLCRAWVICMQGPPPERWRLLSFACSAVACVLRTPVLVAGLP